MNFVSTIRASIERVGAARSPASAVAHSLLSRISILCINVATGILVARTLGPSGRGIAAAISLWPFVMSGLLTLGVPAALRYHLPRNRAGSRELLSCAIVMSGVLGLIAAAAGYAIVPYVLGRYSAAVIAFGQLMMICAPSMLWIDILQGYYESTGDFKRASATIYLPPLLTLAALAILVAIHALTPFAVPLAYELPFVLMSAGTIISMRRFLGIPHNLRERAASLIHYGLRAYGLDILSTLAGRIDQALVVGLLSPESFGYYVVAISGSRIPGVIGTALNTVLFPKASGLCAADAISLVNRSARLSFACTAVAAAAFILALPVLVPFAYGTDFSQVTGLAALLTISVVFGTAASTFGQAFMATGKPEIATLVQALGVAVTIPLMIVLIPHAGIDGAAYAVDISYALRLVCVILAYPIFLNERVPRLLPTQQDVTDVFGRLRRLATS